MEYFKKLLDAAGKQKFLIAAVLAVAAAALLTNITASWKVYRAEPLRDAASRSLMASGSSWFYASGLSEPVPVAALKLAVAAGADPDKAIRVQGLAVFVLLIAATLFALGRLGMTAAAMAALFLAANPYLGYYAMQGSSNLYALLFLVLFWRFFNEAGRGYALAAGLAGALACLSRLDAAWALLLIAGLSWAAERKAFRLKEAGLALGLAALLALPYLAWQRAHFGNAFYAQEVSLRRWANIDRFGYRPAGPVPQGTLTPAGFVLRDGAGAAVAKAFSGLGRMLAYELPRVLYHKFLLVFVFLGVYSAAALGRVRLLAFTAAALLPLLPLAAIAQVPASGGIELRYYLAALWGLCALGGYGFQEILAWLEDAIYKWAVKKGAKPKAYTEK